MAEITDADTSVEALARLEQLKGRHKKVHTVYVENSGWKKTKARKVLSLISKDLRRCRLTVYKVTKREKKIKKGLMKKGDKPQSLIGFTYVEELPMELLYSKYSEHRRLETFAKKGLKCSHPGCHLVGSRLIATKDVQGGIHVDVFTHDYRHMNVDHIYPKSLGGKDTLENKQPMCARHNSRKSNKVSTIYGNQVI